MDNAIISTQKKKLQQQKTRLQQQEILLKLKERKARTRHLITLGGIVAKAQLDHLPTDVLLGACLEVAQSIKNNSDNINKWQKKGADVFESEKQDKMPVLLKMEEKPKQEIRTLIRAQGLKWNQLRQEWYGYAADIEDLKVNLKGLAFKLEIVKS